MYLVGGVGNGLYYPGRFRFHIGYVEKEYSTPHLDKEMIDDLFRKRDEIPFLSWQLCANLSEYGEIGTKEEVFKLSYILR